MSTYHLGDFDPLSLPGTMRRPYWIEPVFEKQLPDSFTHLKENGPQDIEILVVNLPKRITKIKYKI